MINSRTASVLLCCAMVLCLAGSAHAGETAAAEIIKASGVRAGLCVHLGVSDGKLTAELSAGGKFVVHGLATDAASVEKARKYIRSAKVYGKVAVERGNLKKLPYADDLVNLVVADSLPALLGKGLTLKEVGRVLAPKGVLCFGGKLDAGKLKAAGFEGVKSSGTWTVATKSRPAGMDEWTHPFYGPAANPVSRDKLVALPARVRWVDGPLWGRHGSGVGAWAAAGGRVFCVFDRKRYSYMGGRELMARDAFNGLVLWTRALDWHHTKNGRMQTLRTNKRHLVALGDRVYTVLKYRGPLLALDAATGKTVHTYEDINNPVEFLLHEGKLLVAMGREVRAVEPASGKLLWKAAARGAIAAGEGRVFAQTYAGHGKHLLTCLSLADGKQLWQHSAAPRNSGSFHHLYYKGTVVLTDRKTIDGYSAKDGRKLWSFAARQALRGSIHEIVYGARGLIWTHAYFAGKSKSDHKTAWFGLDPKTGDVKKRFDDKNPKKVIHDRHKCCPDHATEKYFLYGTCNFVDTTTGETLRFRGTRTTCGSGFFPANGMSYFTPFACGCASFMRGFRAMAPAPKHKLVEVPDASRLERGGGGRGGGSGASRDDWPAYRHDARRSGSTAAAVPASVTMLWERDLGGRLTAPVIAGGSVYLASIDEHRVMALEAASGKLRWSYTVGGRVDTPPTLYNGLAIFGSADGWVYCLNAASGKLVWRFMAAPADRRILAFGQLESVWPVHGSVAVVGDVAYFGAGRHNLSDGGIAVYALKATDGALVWKQRVHDLPYKNSFICDLPVSDGKMLYIFNRQFDLKTGGHSRCTRSPGVMRAGFSGFTDSDWFDFHNTKSKDRWTDGRGTGKLLASGPAITCGMATDSGRAGAPRPGVGSFKLFGTRGGKKPLWKFPVPVQVRAMALAGARLFVAGRRDPDLSRLAAEKDKKRRFQMFAKMSDAQVSPPDGRLLAYSAADGKKLSELKLASPPVFDGLAAAGGRLYLSCLDGKLRCFGKK
jgi:outer membrane protein assembly factor BamB